MLHWILYGFEHEVTMVPGFPPDNLGRHWVGLAYPNREAMFYGDAVVDTGVFDCKRKAKRALNQVRKAMQKARLTWR